MTASTAEEPSGVIIGLYAGKPEQRWSGKPPSAIGKQPVDGPVHIEAQGFTEDSQADLAVHGGPEKAVHHYASEHMTFWRDMFRERAAQFEPGCFGENVSTSGITELNLCLGDTLSIGTAKVQVCQGRQPCWKLNAHAGLDQMAAQFQKTARTGWYYRVLETGTAGLGDRIELLDRTHADWTLQRLIYSAFRSAA